MNTKSKSSFLLFVVKFLVTFALLYYGTLAVIGLSVPGGHYSEFISKYLDYVSWITESLLIGTQSILSLFGIDTYRAENYVVRIVNGRGVRIAYDCVGYGVMSFWIAFMVASTSSIKRKIIWILIGLLVIWFINIGRISLLLVALNRNWGMPLGIDHHTWFNIAAYLAIFIMIYFFEKGNKNNLGKTANAENAVRFEDARDRK